MTGFLRDAAALAALVSFIVVLGFWSEIATTLAWGGERRAACRRGRWQTPGAVDRLRLAPDRQV